VPARSLPAHPSLDQLKIQARELQRDHRDRDRSVAVRIAAHHPGMKGLPPDEVLDRPLALTDAQLVVAREYGFRDWAGLKHHVEAIVSLGRLQPHPRFAEAVAAFDAGDLEKLRGLIGADPSLVQARTNLGPPFGYFSGATLLHHVAGNPGRDAPLPANIVDIARLLLDAGADVHARTLGPNGGDTMALLITSKQASDRGVTGPLMDLLLGRGARLDVGGEGALDVPLANHAPRAAEKMIELGAKPDVMAAAALGRVDLLQAAFARDDGHLLARPRRHGREMGERDAIGLAMLFAYVRGQREAVDFLLDKEGNWNMTGVNNGTALHRAAGEGDLEMVQRLVAKGADVGIRDDVYAATPLSWAHHNHQTAVSEWIRSQCAVDIHDAVSFGFREHVDARLREDAGAASARRDQWDIPLATPLHCAALARREDLARLLLDHGAEVNILAGNGLTPLDVADAQGATAVVAVLEAHGGARSSGAARPSGHPTLKAFEQVAGDVLEAYRSGTEAAVQRVQEFFNSRVTAWDIRRAVRVRLQKGPSSGSEAGPEISMAEARDAVAGARGFGSWAELADSVTRLGKAWAKPLYWIDAARSRLEVRRTIGDDGWDAIVAVMAEQKIEAIDASGQMTDAAMARIAELDRVASLQLAGSRRLTDAGLRHLARLPRLQRLDLSGCSFTDRGLEILRRLPALRTFELHWHRGVSDAGLAHLADCEQLERVDLMGSPVGDGVIAALAGKRHLGHLKTGTQVTDAALPLLHRFPRFKTWDGTEVRYSLMGAEAEPNHLMIDGPFTDTGLAALRGLDGLFGLSFFWHSHAFTAGGLAWLADLPHLGFLGCEGTRCTDDAMRRIAAIPRLRMLQAQGTVATDDGFEALSRSATLEYLWGRECPNLTGRGFAALSSMPALRGLAVSCKRVDDAGLRALPRFPALRELMPMDVHDTGFAHVGRCEQLEGLWCMYCRDTTDAATERIAGLSKLRTYYAGQTKITDRSLEMLAGMTSIETLEFWNCAGITNAGAALLARLPRLREVSFDGCRRVTAEVTAQFPSGVRARHSS
jgi:ankyrin repeat protein